ncbi:putative wall-associated receptor kinase-like 16 [Phragmites australis]|uniref:putative wall-associated receptor kinase-like 16 n=1 Tax=Phragmites australis TaxID=29695 RepID=UPI002D777BD5|nr:putative wall-associated receptor kinase-like 16 [Phragmites australis]
MMKYPMLLLSIRLLLCLPAAVWMLAAADVPPAMHRPGCRTRCGDVDIPYPFGIGDQCAMNRGFNISCKVVNGIARPFTGSFEVTKISVAHAKAWMKANISWQCHDPKARQKKGSQHQERFSYRPFRFSYVDNKIVVIGCTDASIWGLSGDGRVSTSCRSACLGAEEPKNGLCSGAGCCEADVPKDLEAYGAFFSTDIVNSSTTRNHSPCSYMVVIEKTAFNYSTTYISSTTFSDAYGGRVPVVTDWAIRPYTCEVVASRKNLSSYACISDNSKCADSTNGQGYHCKCLDGYEGNPYVKDGCKDIDECLDNTKYPCTGVCQNTPGNFTCSCPPGKQMISGVCKANQKSSSWVMPVVGASAGAIVFVITIACAYLIKERRKPQQHIKERYFRQHGGLLLFEEIKSQQGVAFKIFSEEELQEATGKFNKKRVVGHGGHGNVYKGLLEGNVEVAIKRCKVVDEHHKKEFGKEMLILSQINHKNIVKLLGCCLEVEVPMLVYEFVPNGTLFDLIHGNHGGHISLATRLQIAHQSAEALAYLHSWASPPILHGHVKSSNILIDCDYTVKVSDFSDSILAPTDESQFAKFVLGTYGYLDPEYICRCQLTDKSDVYSFGVVLLELLTRKKPFNLEGPEDKRSLASRFISVMKEDKLEEILDDQIKNDENIEVLEEIAELAKQCLDMRGANRPSMKEISERLDMLRKVMQHPWAQQDPEQMESLLGESSMAISEVVNTGNLSIEKEATDSLESGR